VCVYAIILSPTRQYKHYTTFGLALWPESCGRNERPRPSDRRNRYLAHS